VSVYNNFLDNILSDNIAKTIGNIGELVQSTKKSLAVLSYQNQSQLFENLSVKK
jgi:hypothetical protein